MRIIIVDDEAVALHIFLDEIMRRGDVEYKFFKDDAAEIEDYVTQTRVDAAFLDIKMPRINGLELARRLIALCPDIKLIFITGLDVGRDNLPEPIRANTLGFIYKPYDRAVLFKYLNMITDVTMKMHVKMFNGFECTVNGVNLEFSTNKSKELFALLVAYNGRTLTMTDAISHMWPNHDVEKAKIIYRDAVWRLRKTLQKVGFNCVNFQRGELSLIKENITCDLWGYLEGRMETFSGDFLKSYDWSLEYLALMDNKNKP